MPNQSNKHLEAIFAPIALDANFPVAKPDRTLRAEIPIEAHVHDCLEIGYCRNGSGIFIVENKILTFRAGDAVVINHSELHTMKSSPGSIADWYFVNLSPAKLLAGYVREDAVIMETEQLSGPEFNNVLSATLHPELCGIINSIIQELQQCSTGYQSVVRAQVWNMMALLRRILPVKHTETLAPCPVSRRKLEQVTPAIRLITQRYHENISMKMLAGKCCYSISNFRKVFHAATGYSPQEYIKQLRMEAVAAMLQHTDENIINIALKCGYSTLSNFSRQFQSHFGMSPREWRASQKSRMR